MPVAARLERRILRETLDDERLAGERRIRCEDPTEREALRRKRKVPIGHVWPGEPLGPHIPILVDAAVTRRDDDQTLRRRGRIRMRTAAPATKGRKEEGARPESE